MDGLGSIIGGLGGGTIGKAIVQLELDTKKYAAEMSAAKAETTASTNTMGSAFGTLKGLGVAAFAGIATAVVAGAAAAVNAASDLTESTNKARVVFGDAAKSVLSFAETSASAFGISEAAALEAAGSFGSMFDAAGIAEDAASKMSITMVRLSADMASFNNTDPSEMLEKLRSGLAGEAEPLRKYGVFLSEAAVQQEAVRIGLVGTNQELTESQKIQARYSLILQQTQKQQGDFARTSDSLANQQRILSAEFTDLSATIGRLLLPAVTAIAGGLSDLGKVLLFVTCATENFDEATQKAARNVAEAELDVAAWVEEHTKAIPIIGGFVDVWDQVTAAQDAAHDSMGLTQDQLDALTQGITSGAPDYLAFRDHWVDIFDAFLGGSGKIDAANGMIEQTTGIVGRFLGIAPKVEHEVVEVFSHKIPKAFRDTRDALIAEIPALRGTTETWKDTFTLSPGELAKIANSWARIARTIASDLREIGHADLTPAMREAISALPPEMRHAFVEGNAHQRSAIVQSIKSTLKVEDQIPGLARQALTGGQQVGIQMANGMEQGLASRATVVAAEARAVVSKALAAARAEAGATSPSKRMAELGVDMMVGLADGISDAEGKAIAAAAGALDKTIEGIKSQLGKVQSAASSFRDAISGGFSSFLDLSGAFGLGEGGWSTPGDISTFIQSQLVGATQLADVLRALRTQGAGKDLLAQVAGGGAEAVPFAQTLLQGGPQAIDDINASLQTISDLASQTGKALSESFFGERIGRLEAQLERVNNKLDRLADLEREGHSHDVNLDGEKVTQTIRREMIRTGSRNSDIFGGRA